jgi:flavin reductase (DIM6/NTAB) family NADH-FMN oxidoreductase RutF
MATEGAPPEFKLALDSTAVPHGPDGIGESPFDFIAAPEAMEYPSELGDDPAIALRRTLGMFATGVTVITTSAHDEVHGMTANAFMSASLNPPLVLISIDRRAKMCNLLHEGDRYGVSILGEHQTEMSDRFAGRADASVPQPAFEIVRETPLVEGALAHFVARVDRTYYAGDHSLFLGHVEYARHNEGAPLLYHGGQYERLGKVEPVVPELPAGLLPPLLAAGEQCSFADGDRIVKLGEVGDQLFVILDGSVILRRPGHPDKRLESGSYFGEVGALSGQPRVSDAVADGPVSCVAVQSDALKSVLAGSPEAAWEMLGTLAQRVREA